jgi:hypothetical protein
MFGGDILRRDTAIGCRGGGGSLMEVWAGLELRSPSCVEFAESAVAAEDWCPYARKNRIISADASGPIGSV